ncbi:sensor domain-containing protein [Mycolicibacterium senegalense]|uniref:sensor domain-containing protein n=1 Tax=Mycolicibacterium senegalense TaxID=1796 RepID=UPI003AB0DC40
MRLLVGACAIGLLLAGCSTAVDGQAKKAPEVDEQPSATTGPTTPPPPTASTPDLARAALLKRSELGAIVGDTDVRQELAFDKPDQSPAGIEPPQCAVRALFQQSRAAYDYLVAMGDQNTGARGQSVSQLIQVFPVTNKAWREPNRHARRVASDIVVKFNHEQCREGTVATITVDGKTQHWTAGPVTSENPAALTDTMQETTRGGAGMDRVQGGRPRSCYHSVLARANAVVESVVCGDGDSQAQANQIIDRIAAKLPAG